MQTDHRGIRSNHDHPASRGHMSHDPLARSPIQLLKVGLPFLAGCAALFSSVVPVHAAAAANTLNVLHVFQGGSDGAEPLGNVLLDGQGNLYGVTLLGGTNNAGTIYKITPAGQESVVYSFKGGTDGAEPYNVALLMDAAGNLYGTTQIGGAYGHGTVFKVDSTGSETILHSFGNGQDGAYPASGVIADKSGNLYGTAASGGLYNNGAVYKLAANGKETLLHSFTYSGDGVFPVAPLVMDSSGNFFGATSSGGTGNGAVFKLSPKGKETLLYSFGDGGDDGVYPYGALLLDKKGNLFGTTEFGGPPGYGIVFKVSKGGKEELVHVFTAAGVDGAYPLAGLASDTAGNLYGTTSAGGSLSFGTIFEVSKKGVETVLYSFTNGNDGSSPGAGLTLAKDSTIYGTASSGGAGYGVVFKFKTK